MNKQAITVLVLATLLIIAGIGASSLYLHRINQEYNLNSQASSIEFSPPTQVVRNRIEINIPSRKLFLINGNFIVKEYSIAVGKSKEFMTPIGNFKVEVKDAKPGWQNPSNNQKIAPGSSNPLGTRWIGFHKEKGNLVYGIHGTNEPESIGKFISHGCIRMKIADAEELFSQIQIGTPIKIRYERIDIKRENNALALTIYPDPYNLKPLNENEVLKAIQSKYSKAKIDKTKVKQMLSTKTNQNLIFKTGYLEG